MVFFAIILNEGVRHIGNIKLGPINPFHRYGDIGIIIGDKKSWGKGFAKEAIALLMDTAFKKLKLHKVTAGCYAPNKGSQKAFLANGFRVAGIRKNQYRSGNGYCNEILLEKINSKHL